MPSSIPPAQDSGLRVRVAPPEVVVVDWPVRDRPVTASLALAVAAGASWVAVWATGNAAAGAVVGVLLAVTLWRTWLPVQFRIGPEGVVQSVLGWRRRISWSAVRSFDLRGDGVVLMPDVAPTPLATLRGIYLHWGEQRDAVMAQVDHYLLGRRLSAMGSSHERV